MNISEILNNETFVKSLMDMMKPISEIEISFDVEIMIIINISLHDLGMVVYYLLLSNNDLDMWKASDHTNFIN